MNICYCGQPADSITGSYIHLTTVTYKTEYTTLVMNSITVQKVTLNIFKFCW
jgi:hypothetical protein